MASDEERSDRGEVRGGGCVPNERLEKDGESVCSRARITRRSEVR